MKSITAYLKKIAGWTPTILLAGLCITAIFPLDKVFINSLSFSTGQYSDFTTYRLYAFDILLVITAVYAILGIIVKRKNESPRGEANPPRGISLFTRGGIIILIIILYHVVGSHFTTWWDIYQIWISLRLILITLIAFYFSPLSHETINKKFVSLIMYVLFFTQALIVLGQFILQKSIGLKLIGEPAISGTTYDVAKVVSHGTVWLRSYGTFPHANILGGAFAITSLIMAYKLFKDQNYTTWWGVGLFTATMCLALAVSRSAALGLAVGVGVIGGFMFHMKHEKSNFANRKIFFATLALIIPFFIFGELWFTPLASRQAAISERVELIEAGKKIFSEVPVFGVGNGRSLFHMKHNLPVNTPTWNIQPIHNVWLLILVEKGLLGLLLALSILYLLFINVLKNLYKRGAIIWFGISSILLVISFFDHYLYTIFQGQIILWGWVGWGIAICDSPNQQES